MNEESSVFLVKWRPFGIDLWFGVKENRKRAGLGFNGVFLDAQLYLSGLFFVFFF